MTYLQDRELKKYVHNEYAFSVKKKSLRGFDEVGFLYRLTWPNIP